MQKERRESLRVLGAVFCGVFFCLPFFALAIRNLAWWSMTRSDAYYFKFPYLTFACIPFCLGLIASGPVIFAFKRRSYGGWLFFITFLVCAVAFFPLFHIGPYQGMVTDSQYLDAVESGVGFWAYDHGRYPATDVEIAEALHDAARDKRLVKAALYWADPGRIPPESQYLRRGAVVPYQVVVEQNAAGPHVKNVSRRPGVVYYSVSPNRKEYWMTMTILPSDSPGYAKLKEYIDPVHREWHGEWSVDPAKE